MSNRNTFVEGQDVYSDLYGRGKILRTDGRIEDATPNHHANKWPLVVCFNDDDSFLVTFNKHGWYNFTSPDPSKDIRPLSTREFVRPVLGPGESMISKRDVLWLAIGSALAIGGGIVGMVVGGGWTN